MEIIFKWLGCGMKLRSDDPTSMKDFVLGIQHRVNEIKTSPSGTQDENSKINSKRMEFMLDTICDIKNNKKRTKGDPAHHTRLKKWLQKLRADEILLRGLKWQKLLDPNKKGQWWLSGDLANTSENVEFVATTFSTEALETQKLVQLASSQRMNTDLRRAIFCIIMSGEDYLDAFEKLLRLDISGKQDREIMRVLVHCCLQEKMFNKYYTVLASKLCSHDKNHKFSLQYCLWDHFKELDSMELIRSMNLARFTAEMLANFSLSLAVLKSVDFADPVQLTPKRVMHFRMLFEFVFNMEDSLVWNVFTRIASLPELEILSTSILYFVKQYVVAPNKGFIGKFKIVKKALDNAAGVLK
ncbi:nucleolar MIF4G domain-containing protein 1-like isoform X1 [Carex littledalei]|uniref:Nucleolar MIF4G domain-containing protein 1-like isoform X1 n=1 Tax=Carex littledalei TaxID=544730 RepID=A0A833QR29_9POAL|nr:nucleolar MIF4G domain-containing protein 1-like isoform X1 [Carex littledalei]